MSDVAVRLRNIVCEKLFVDSDKVVDDARLYDDLGADSLDAVGIQVATEEEFGMKLPDGALVGAETFGDLVKLVETHKVNG